MKRVEKYYSNEIVFRGHPDKVCDQISAAILFEAMKQDPNTRAGIETAGGKGKIFITGEITTKAKLDVEDIVKKVLKSVGYSTNYEIINNLGFQSEDIALGVDIGGAGDQGMMFGYACTDTPELLPTAMVILQRFAKAYDKLRRDEPSAFYPDGKAQITGVYDKHFRLVRIKDFVISYQNCEVKDYKGTMDAEVMSLAKAICFDYNVPVERFHINPTGKFKIGGFEGDAGLTGRKIVVDAYQSFANVGGGCMNGKDPTKVDFSAAHKARQLAKRFLTQFKLKWCEVQISYAIGESLPLAIYIDSNKGNILLPEEEYSKLRIECTPRNIIKDLCLQAIDFVELAKFGHFTN